jgi:hypothetical protein
MFLYSRYCVFENSLTISGEKKTLVGSASRQRSLATFIDNATTS